ncbi:TSUP family transporter [Nocardioides sp. zg-1230]|uniref:sulfite exporter TauE/SafE family protein n=1 Tax=Nocardioides sp. zg-1230 TaxID=2736601 RepID=UPI001556198E|nr:TSUP family transporter [Nocardioides sp. zg-1230]NPC45223.1 TSUP family transporter [Nocardioides sp. zg-1230]
MGDLSLEVALFLVLAALAAGFVDAVVGGGGLIQLPALLLGLPGASVVQIAATNKLSSFCGTSISAATYVRRIRPDPRTFLPLMVAAGLGSAGGALVASLLPRSAFDPIILVVLVVVGAYVWFKPSVGELTNLRFQGGQHITAVVLTGLTIGFYDGAIGPGTGSFFVFALVGLLGYNFLEASAKAKLANWATNLAALAVFIPQGAVIWDLALVMAAANVTGGYIGARLAMARGARFVRAFFLVVVAGFVVRLGGGLLGWW